ncbi:MAG: ABC transporter ATP-binding protein [Lachnospiraceae bacterium]|nr:ABC transporter ATP-binding protein [Lachnospiraceae bacterium]
MDNKDIILQLDNVSKSFGLNNYELKVIDNLSLNIPNKKLIIIRGRSGSGKTTQLNILGTLDNATSGEIIFDGQKYSSLSETERESIRRYDMGFVFQSIALIPIMNAYENVDFALRSAGIDKDMDSRIKEVLSLVGLSDRITHYPAQLSGGEQQRVAIARAIAHRPKIVFADEPTGALDTATGIVVVKLFRELVNKEGITVVMTTHDEGLMGMADMVIKLGEDKS